MKEWVQLLKIEHKIKENLLEKGEPDGEIWDQWLECWRRLQLTRDVRLLHWDKKKFCGYFLSKENEKPLHWMDWALRIHLKTDAFKKMVLFLDQKDGLHGSLEIQTQWLMGLRGNLKRQVLAALIKQDETRKESFLKTLSWKEVLGLNEEDRKKSLWLKLDNADMLEREEWSRQIKKMTVTERTLFVQCWSQVLADKAESLKDHWFRYERHYSQNKTEIELENEFKKLRDFESYEYGRVGGSLENPYKKPIKNIGKWVNVYWSYCLNQDASWAWNDCQKLLQSKGVEWMDDQGMITTQPWMNLDEVRGLNNLIHSKQWDQDSAQAFVHPENWRVPMKVFALCQGALECARQTKDETASWNVQAQDLWNWFLQGITQGHQIGAKPLYEWIERVAKEHRMDWNRLECSGWNPWGVMYLCHQIRGMPWKDESQWMWEGNALHPAIEHMMSKKNVEDKMTYIPDEWKQWQAQWEMNQMKGMLLDSEGNIENDFQKSKVKTKRI